MGRLRRWARARSRRSARSSSRSRARAPPGARARPADRGLAVYQFRQITRESRVPGLRHGHRGLRPVLHLLHRARSRAAASAAAASAEILEEVAHLAARGYTRGHAARPDGQRLPRSRGGLRPGRAAAPRRRASPGVRAPALHHVASRASSTTTLVDALAAGGPIAPYLHLPAQSGSDRVLLPDEAPLRPRRSTSPRSRASGRASPSIAISSDFIVGFPGETEEDFEETLALVREVRFASLFAFRYSPRPGTASARWGSETEVPDDGRRRAPRAAPRPPGGASSARSTRASSGREFEVLSRARTARGRAGPDLLQPHRPRRGRRRRRAAGEYARVRDRARPCRIR